MTSAERKNIFEKVEQLVRTRYFDPHFNGRDWLALVDQHRPRILAATDDGSFELEVNSLLHALGTSHTHFFSPRTRIPGDSSINATFRPVSTSSGLRWVFQDVQPGGPADRAGIKPGDILLAIENMAVEPPRMPDFRMSSSSSLALIHRKGVDRELTITVKTSVPKYPARPYSEPQNVTVSVLENGVGLLRVAMFPGIIGVDFAHEIDDAMRKLKGCEALILDLRGNPGGGIGGLRLMSYLVPDKRPVGYSLTRKRAENGYRREELPTLNGIPDQKWKLPLLALKFVGRDLSIATVTEGRGPRRFHGRIVALVNEHTSGAAEMVAGFLQENGLGKVVGTKTAGRLLAGKGFKVGQDYILMIPVGAYLSWNGRRYEGNGIDPDIIADWSHGNPESEDDPQIRVALNLAG
jgi:C-terminal processing protease CtpA/Prc